MVRRRNNLFDSVDRLTIILFLLLMFLGWLNIYAAVYSEEHPSIFDLSQRYGKQLLWIAATVVIAVFILVMDNRFFTFFAWPIYITLIIMLFAVLIMGKEINGARSWFEIGSFGLQPTEFAKFATALALARYLSMHGVSLNKFSNLLFATFLFILPAVLTSLQPDMGSALVFMVFFIVLFREGLSPFIFISGLLAVILFFVTLMVDNSTYIVAGLIITALLLVWAGMRDGALMLKSILVLSVLAGVGFLSAYLIFDTLTVAKILVISVFLASPLVVYYVFRTRANTLLVIYLFLAASFVYTYSVDYGFDKLLEPHQKTRVNILLGKESDPFGTEYNVNQSKISIGSGGFAGKGYLNGTQTKFKFVPEQSTDFIFCTVGEEWGFLGSFVAVALFIALILRLIWLAERQKSAFSRIYGYGVASIIFFHFFINIGMTIGVVPVIGIPLPFFSAGGSSLWGFTILLFIFLRLDAGRTEYLI